MLLKQHPYSITITVCVSFLHFITPLGAKTFVFARALGVKRRFRLAISRLCLFQSYQGNVTLSQGLGTLFKLATACLHV